VLLLQLLLLLLLLQLLQLLQTYTSASTRFVFLVVVLHVTKSLRPL
jgi:hypothetical protein